MAQRRGIREYLPGDRITWMHYHLDGTATERTGTVWDAAPPVRMRELHTGDSIQVAWWVVPDEALPTDAYHCIAVGKAGREKPAHGRWLDGIGGAWVTGGTLYSSDYVGSAPGWLTNRAARVAWETRQANAAAA